MGRFHYHADGTGHSHEDGDHDHEHADHEHGVGDHSGYQTGVSWVNTSNGFGGECHLDATMFRSADVCDWFTSLAQHT